MKELREDRTLQKATGLKVIPSDSAVGDWLLRKANAMGGTKEALEG